MPGEEARWHPEERRTRAAGPPQRVTSREALRILLSIGPTETSHFQTWHDKAGNAPMVTDPTNGLFFPDLTGAGEDLKANLIMPEPCPFLGIPGLPPCSIIRPTASENAAMDALTSLMDDGLFIGQYVDFFRFVRRLAEAADDARFEG